MSVRIRLRRVGRKKQPYYRVVVAQAEAPRDGAYIDEVGFYNPRTRPAFLTMDLEKVDSWIEKGAEVTTSAASLIRKARKGGDTKIRFVAPGEETPQLKTATKPERRPQSQAVKPEEAEAPAAQAEAAEAQAETEAPAAEPVAAEPTDALEGAAPDAEKAPPAEAAAGGETAEAVASTETEAPKSKKAATKKAAAAAAPEAAAEAEAPEASADSSAEGEAAEAPDAGEAESAEGETEEK